MNPLAYALIGAAAVVIVVVALLLLRRGRGEPRITLVALTPADTARYRREMQLASDLLESQPAQAASRARGITDEVMRRRGFPARFDAEQQVKDLRGVSREAGQRLAEANVDVRALQDPEAAARALRAYSVVMESLLTEVREG